MDEENQITFTQVGVTFITSFIGLMVYQLTIGVFLDEWVYGVVGYLECNAWCQKEMMIVLSPIAWIYFLIKFTIGCLFVWLIIMAIKKHRYSRQADEFDVWQ